MNLENKIKELVFSCFDAKKVDEISRKIDENENVIPSSAFVRIVSRYGITFDFDVNALITLAIHNNP